MANQKSANRVLLFFLVLFAATAMLFVMGMLTREWDVDTKEGYFIDGDRVFPRPLTTYKDESFTNIKNIIVNRIVKEPLNLAATLIFLCAIIHSLLTSKINRIGKTFASRKKEGPEKNMEHSECKGASFREEALHCLGEIELVFGLWTLPLIAAIVYFYNWDVAVFYLDSRVFTEVLFVIVIMSLAASKPILDAAEKSLNLVAKIGGCSIAAWWLAILTIAPLLGSFITEPGAMTIAAILLARQFYYYRPSKKFAYATLGLLFVNISVGGVLTNFAAPVILVVAHPWKWTSGFMMANFGWKAIAGVIIANASYFLVFRKAFFRMEHKKNVQILAESYVHSRDKGHALKKEQWCGIPFWIYMMHIVFFLGVVVNNEHPIIFIGIFIFYIGFHQATASHQDPLHLRAPMLVGFFFTGLIIHGSMQSWWVSPILSRLGEASLMSMTAVLTAFNDNATLTYMTTKIPNLPDAVKYAVVAGAITGGGLTVIANAPNPAGQVLLKKYFKYGISPLYLFLGALFPTILVGLIFYFF